MVAIKESDPPYLRFARLCSFSVGVDTHVVAMVEVYQGYDRVLFSFTMIESGRCFLFVYLIL